MTGDSAQSSDDASSGGGLATAMPPASPRVRLGATNNVSHSNSLTPSPNLLLSEEELAALMAMPRDAYRAPIRSVINPPNRIFARYRVPGPSGDPGGWLLQEPLTVAAQRMVEASAVAGLAPAPRVAGSGANANSGTRVQFGAAGTSAVSIGSAEATAALSPVTDLDASGAGVAGSDVPASGAAASGH